MNKNMLGIVFGTFIVAIVLALPIGLSIGLATVLPNFINPKFPVDMIDIIQAMVRGIDSTPILAIPLFMLSGAIMTRGGISKRLFDVFALIAGRRTAGMPIAVIVTCLFYGAISGSGPATCAAVGYMTIPLLVSLGYDKVFSAAIVTAAGGLGVIIPPSIPFIFWALLNPNASVSNMFLAGIIPGILIALCMSVYAFMYCKRNGEDKLKIEANYNELRKRGVWNVLKEGFWALLTPVIILGSIYGGIATPTEAACISVFYALIVCIFVYKTIDFKNLMTLLKQAVASYAPLVFIIGLSTAFARVLTFLKAADVFSSFITSTISSPVVFMLTLDVILLILGMFMDVGPAMMILAPVLAPITQMYGLNITYVGIVFVVCLAVGFVTPPFGLNLFVSAPLIDTPVMTLGKKSVPFIISFLIALLIITLVPNISLFLVGGGPWFLG